MIYKYNLIEPVINKQKPFIDDKGFLIIPNIKRKYRYYIEVSRYNTNTYTTEYFLLLGVFKFDDQCRKCRVDDYGRLKLFTHAKFREFVVEQAKANGNLRFTYMESEDDSDIYLIE